ncbi:hypothetical protein EVAR_41966_1 [Eumeta japonica]|uniref:Uncharacterized protein n=1 Tax=Eumeta variegata TaxID=151549 RepID=A0A4C1WQ93_EUMVA|nr:hypothetical protein EVAR_41966_1 [Eumeta japonica]
MLLGFKNFKNSVKGFRSVEENENHPNTIVESHENTHRLTFTVGDDITLAHGLAASEALKSLRGGIIDESRTGGTIVKFWKKQRLRWVDHLKRMDDTRAVKTIFNWIPQQKKLRRRPKKRGQDCIEKDLRNMSRKTSWKREAKDRKKFFPRVSKYGGARVKRACKLARKAIQKHLHTKARAARPGAGGRDGQTNNARGRRKGCVDAIGVARWNIFPAVKRSTFTFEVLLL